MGKADAAVELRVAAHALFDAGHADQDEADISAVKLIAQMFQGRVGQPFGLIDDDQLNLSAPGVYDFDAFGRLALIDAGLDAAPKLVEVFANGREGGRDRGVWNTVRDRARAA